MSPPALDIPLHVKYIQNLDKVSPSVAKLGPGGGRADNVEKGPSVPPHRTPSGKRCVLGTDGIMYNGTSRRIAKG